MDAKDTVKISGTIKEEHTMPMLILDWLADDLIDRYGNFRSTLTWYRMYCAGKFGTNKDDYVKGFERLKESYDHLWDDYEANYLEWRDWMKKPIKNLLDTIESILTSKRLTDENIRQISLLILSFQNQQEDDMRRNYTTAQVDKDIRMDYPEDLYKAVYDLLKSDSTDEAIVNAFKFLDKHLQELLNVSPYQYHGEALINYAFAPQSGVLQLGTDPNEQIGLRNFFSGANAIFRNPSAHRFINHDLFVSASVVAMVATMAGIATELAKKNSSSN